MDEYLQRLFGSGPSYLGQLMGEDAERLRREAQNQGLLGTGIGLLMASGPSAQRQNIGQIIGQGLMTGQQAYRGAIQQALQDKMIGLQLSEIAKKQKAEQAIPGLIQGAMVAPQRQFTDLERMEMPTPSVTTGPAQLDINKLISTATAAGVPLGSVLPLAKGIGEITQRPTKEVGGALFELQDGKWVKVAGNPKTSTATIYKDGLKQTVAVDEAGNIVGYLGGTEAPPTSKRSIQTIYDTSGKERKVVFDEVTGTYTEIGSVKAGEVKTPSLMDLAFAQNKIDPSTPLSEITPENLEKVFNTYARFRQGTDKPGTVVNITEGQKGLENEIRVSSQFKGEPVYKAFQEVKSAYGQITNAIDLRSPAGDLAAATKIMKLLDPGSVVRESELGMAMQATGLVDRIRGFADNVIKGTKLTEQQRTDFRRLADSLYADSARSYNSKLGEYQNLGARYGLNTSALGSPVDITEAAPKPPAQPLLSISREAAAAELRRRRQGGS